MKKTRRLWLLVGAAAVLALVGCEATPAAEIDAASAVDATGADDAGSGGGFDTIASPDLGAPPPPPVTPSWCGPQPTPPTIELALDAHALFLPLEQAGCGLLRIEHDLDGDGTVDETETLPAGEGAAAFGLGWTEETDFQGRVPEIWLGVARGERDEDGALRLTVDTQRNDHSAEQRAIRHYDADGRLVREEQWYNDRMWFELDLGWADDRLQTASHTDHVNGSSGPTTRIFTWSWDAAGLTGATVAAPGAETPEQEVRWTRDDAGRPIRAERFANGSPLLTQSWSYDEDGALEGRRVEQPAGGASWDRYLLDDHAPWAEKISYTRYDWADSLLRPTPAGCTRLPSSISHGYPAAEEVYEMGWPVGERPSGMGFDYGYAGYGYYYGDLGWFGHGGVGGGDEPLSYGDSGTVVVGYDPAGRAIDELVETRFDDGRVRHRSRTRRFVGDLLVEDRRALRFGALDYTTTMTFAYDAEGRVLERRYDLDETTLASHTWSYDPLGGSISAHGIAHHGSPWAEFVGHEWEWLDTPPDLSDLEGEPPLWWRHERVHQDEGRRVVMQKRNVPDDTVVVYGELEWNADGHLVTVIAGSGRQLLSYDAQGRLRYLGTDYDGDGEAERFYAWETGPDGRLLSTEHVDRDRSVHERTHFVYACEP